MWERVFLDAWKSLPIPECWLVVGERQPKWKAYRGIGRYNTCINIQTYYVYTYIRGCRWKTSGVRQTTGIAIGPATTECVYRYTLRMWKDLSLLVDREGWMCLWLCAYADFLANESGRSRVVSGCKIFWWPWPGTPRMSTTIRYWKHLNNCLKW